MFRHGETDANRVGILQGHLDTRLSPLGVNQANQLSVVCKQLPIDVIHSSDLIRAKATAAKLSQNAGRLLCYSHRLREINYGHLNGQRIDQLDDTKRQQLHQLYQQHIPLPDPHAETMAQLESRLVGYLDSIMDWPQHNHGIISHGQALNCLLHALLGWPKHNMHLLQLTNCSVTELKFTQDRWQLVRLNQDVTSILKGIS